MGTLLPLAVGILALVAVVGAGAHDALRLSDRGPLAGQRGSILAVGTILLMLDILIIATVHMVIRRRRRRMRPPEATDRWQEPIEPDIRWIRLVLGIAIALAVLLPLLLLLAALGMSIHSVTQIRAGGPCPACILPTPCPLPCCRHWWFSR